MDRPLVDGEQLSLRELANNDFERRLFQNRLLSFYLLLLPNLIVDLALISRDETDSNTNIVIESLLMNFVMAGVFYMMESVEIKNTDEAFRYPHGLKEWSWFIRTFLPYALATLLHEGLGQNQLQTSLYFIATMMVTTGFFTSLYLGGRNHDLNHEELEKNQPE